MNPYILLKSRLETETRLPISSHLRQPIYIRNTLPNYSNCRLVDSLQACRRGLDELMATTAYKKLSLPGLITEDIVARLAKADVVASCTAV